MVLDFVFTVVVFVKEFVLGGDIFLVGVVLRVFLRCLF